MESNEKKQAAPPYVAYKTLSNFLDRFKQGVPARIDRGLMGSMSGAAQSQVTTALRFLGMISDKGIPQQLLHRYVSGQDDERRVALLEALTNSYPFLFGDRFDLSRATGQQLREAFETNTSATGETLGRCIAFFKDAAADAMLILSPYIKEKRARAAGPRKRPSAQKERSRADQNPAPQHSSFSPLGGMPAQTSLLLSGLFMRLPKPGTKWEREERERWVQTLNNVLLLEYPEV
ncbi:MAG TPA: DUF5343 domain-containing protein [Terracidiphilus sp.]|nr:DUF5343 domain-containing protein [Terracidiphilus sp.]